MKVFRAGLKPRYIDEPTPQEKARITAPQGPVQGFTNPATQRQKPGLQLGHTLPPVQGLPAVDPTTPVAEGGGAQIIASVAPQALIDNNLGKTDEGQKA